MSKLKTFWRDHIESTLRRVLQYVSFKLLSEFYVQVSRQWSF
jgi:cytoplasmic iron level regulating protein YaaA (DUF328/UPF0246 family)